jgi:hypothetical protein
LKASDEEAAAQKQALDEAVASQKQAEKLAKAAQEAEAQRLYQRYMGLIKGMPRLPYPLINRIFFYAIILGLVVIGWALYMAAVLGTIVFVLLGIEAALMVIGVVLDLSSARERTAYEAQQVYLLDKENPGFSDFYHAWEKAQAEAKAAQDAVKARQAAERNKAILLGIVAVGLAGAQAYREHEDRRALHEARDALRNIDRKL